MKKRFLVRWCALAGLTGLVAALGVTGPAWSRSRLPECAPGTASNRPPTRPAGPHTPGACRADTGRAPESAVQVDQMRDNSTAGGYHHLGAGTAGEWAGVYGRVSVVNSTVRAYSYDFVAARFMAKQDMGGGRIAWLEAGWAETGWAGAGRQHIYTYHTNSRTWQFYPQYAVRPGDRIWIDVHTDSGGIWQAWLWWNNRWNLLTAQKLPIGGTAYVEQYVEVHVDSRRRGRIDVPQVTVDNVQLRPSGGNGRYWRADVPTLTADSVQQRGRSFCLDWTTRYDTWRAGSCSKESR
ncbi:hypothetical protein [Jidongwangia harbinensis]|uniref:hypothetical protein n=1 Tax=Jidongwangia harbinensis TaxID=2878561 RepID=UPI001CD9EA96|nr:hypothetical protein [Jidongwangia harbinensis]MCA2218067.1 hypothetical protein [Jidongwangia harbinensis]